MARRRGPGRNRAPGRRPPGQAAPGAPLPASRPAQVGGGAALQARVGFVLGVLAMFALPLAYQWTLQPDSNPLGSAEAVTVVEVAGIVAAAMALLLGIRVRAAGDRSSTGAVWAPRLGGAAIVGYLMTIVLVGPRGA